MIKFKFIFFILIINSCFLEKTEARKSIFDIFKKIKNKKELEKQKAKNTSSSIKKSKISIDKLITKEFKDQIKFEDGYKKSTNYHIDGKLFVTRKNFEGYKKIGRASFYDQGFHGKKTAIGDRFDRAEITGAIRDLPIPCVVKVTNLRNGKSIIVLINDRGPYVFRKNHILTSKTKFKNDRIIDLSRRAAERLDFIRDGITDVEVECLPKFSKLVSKIYGLVLKGNIRAKILFNKIKKGIN